MKFSPTNPYLQKKTYPKNNCGDKVPNLYTEPQVLFDNMDMSEEKKTIR